MPAQETSSPPTPPPKSAPQKALEKLGYTVQPIKEIEYPAAHIALANGDATFMADHWNPLHADYYKNAGGDAKLFAAWNFRKDAYIDFINATPGHQIPMLKSVTGSQEYLSHPLLAKYRKELDVTIDTLSKAHATCKPTDDFPLITKAGEIQGSGIFAETIQRVVIEGMPPKRAAAMGQDRIARLMR